MSEIDDLDEFIIEPDRSGSARRIRAGLRAARAMGPKTLKPLWKRQIDAEKVAASRAEKQLIAYHQPEEN